VIEAFVQGLGGALFEEIRFENGRILNHRFSAYRLPRFTDVPDIDVLLVVRKDFQPEGAEETPIVVGTAPAGPVFGRAGGPRRGLDRV
jgi:isoquinoline 1-oxidoreductase